MTDSLNTRDRPRADAVSSELPPDPVLPRAPHSDHPDRIRAGAYRPLILLWVLCAGAAVGGLAEWLVWNRSPWEGLGAAATIAGLLKLVARVKGIPAWPWQYQHGA